MPDTAALSSPRDHALVSADGRLGAAPRSSRADLSRILALARSAAPERGLVVHMHGGLVSRDYALEQIVKPLSQHYRQAGAYPLFMVWESGLAETLLNNRQELIKDPAFRELVKKVAEWSLRKVSVTGEVVYRGTGDTRIGSVQEFRRAFDAFFDEQRSTPPCDVADEVAHSDELRTRAGTLSQYTLAQQIAAGLDTDRAFKQAMAQAYNAAISPSEVQTKGAGDRQASPHHLLDPEALDAMFPPAFDTPSESEGEIKTRGVLSWLSVARYVAGIVIAVVKRYGAGTEHGLYCTVVEEVLRSAFAGSLGTAVWNAMKQDTLDAFGDDPEACGRLLIAALKQGQDHGQGFSRLTLVGHSTGAIYISHFLDEMRRQGLDMPVQVAFLAPAITCDLFAQTIERHGSDQLQRFRLFAMSDERECADRLFNPLYLRSLLYFVSGLLEGRAGEGTWAPVVGMPLVGMQRFFTQQRFLDCPSVRTVHRFLHDVPDRLVWSHAADRAPGFNSDASKHGDFDNDPSTLASLKAFIQG
jgi:hypothetical protein